MHGTIARIELMPDELDRLMNRTLREKVFEKFKEIGFSYVTADLAGYRMGSMNEVLNREKNGALNREKNGALNREQNGALNPKKDNALNPEMVDVQEGQGR